jgi:stage V sporulation protein B
MFLGGLVKLVAVAVLTGNPAIGIVGTPIGTLLCYLCITVLNVLSIRNLIGEPPALLKNLIRPFAAAAIMGLLVSGSLMGLRALGITSRLILCGAPICVGVAVYVVLVIVFKAITREDCLLLPKGAKIAKLLRL